MSPGADHARFCSLLFHEDAAAAAAAAAFLAFSSSSCLFSAT
jgi:hypothetical protein